MNHDLLDFMRQLSAEMSAEYARVQKRATEDPGTAGDQGEENWAALLREWLPRNYEVVTKGRIISHLGLTSPQIDVLVLKGTYPKKLLDKKLYLAAGVAAAFECKLTLKASHVTKAVENCTKIKKLYMVRTGTPFKEVHTPIVYGLLAHSHSWKGANSAPAQNIVTMLREADREFVSHPRLQLDLLCVADLASWMSSVNVFLGPQMVDEWSTLAQLYGPEGAATTAYFGHAGEYQQKGHSFTPIGVLISYLTQKLAWEEPALRDLADYYRLAYIAGSGFGYARFWPSSIYSEVIRSCVEAGQLSYGTQWDEWSVAFV